MCPPLPSLKVTLFVPETKKLDQQLDDFTESSFFSSKYFTFFALLLSRFEW